MLKIVWLDTETRSRVDISAGTDRYTRAAEGVIVTYVFATGPAKIWLPRIEPIPRDLKDAFDDPEFLIVAHNAAFDRLILARALKIYIPLARFRCTMAGASAHGLPGSLEALGTVCMLTADEGKLVDDKGLIQTFCCPQPATGEFIEPEDAPIEWDRFCKYAIRDTEALRAVFNRMPQTNYGGANLRSWLLDQLINERGFGFDVKLAQAASEFLDKAREASRKVMLSNTDGAIGSATQAKRLLAYVRNKYGIDIESMKAGDVREYLESDDLDPILRTVLEERLEAGKNAGSKFKRGLMLVGPGDRIRHWCRWSGAGRTGRHAGRGLQPHNLARPSITVRRPAGHPRAGHIELEPVKANVIDDVIIPGIYSGEALNNPLVYGGPFEAVAIAVRHGIIAAPGNELVVGDFKNIESVVTPWLAGEQSVLDAFQFSFDNPKDKSKDPYRILAGKMLGKRPEDVNESERQSGKVVLLACFAKETQVLTDTGYKHIVDVLDTDQLWDGLEWINHKGVIAQGVQQVVSVDGIEATPSHQVNVAGSWKPVSKLVSSRHTLLQALATGSENLPLSAQPPASGKVRALLSYVHAAVKRIALTVARFAGDVPHVVTIVPNGEVELPESPSDGSDIKTSSPTPHIGADYSTGSVRLLLDVTAQIINCMKITAGEASTSTPLGEKINDLFSRILSVLRGGMIRIWRWTESIIVKDTSPAIYGSQQERKTWRTDVTCEPCSGVFMNLKPVYDIAHAGPRNRFTIRTNSGHLLVHNCNFGGGVAAIVNMSIAYQMDLDPLAGIVLPTATPEQLEKANTAWERAFLKGEDFELERDVYMACDILKQAFRTANPAVNKMRYDLDTAIKEAVADKNGTVYHVARCVIWCNASFLVIQLPSGRRLLYASPILKEEEVDDPLGGKKWKSRYVTYLTVRGRSWRRERAWSGLFVENIVQATANCVLRAAMLRVHDDTLTVPEIAAYLETLEPYARTAISLHVHDEIGVDVPKGMYSEARFMAVLKQKEKWMEGLPIAADLWSNFRYGKR